MYICGGYHIYIYMTFTGATKWDSGSLSYRLSGIRIMKNIVYWFLFAALLFTLLFVNIPMDSAVFLHGF